MFNIDRLDFLGTDEFDKILDKLFSGCRIERTRDEDGIPRARVFFPSRGDSRTARDNDFGEEPTWRKEVRIEAPTKAVDFPTEDIKPKEPKSLLEMLEDGDERLEKLLGKIVDKRLDERNIKPAQDEGYAEEYDPEPKKDISVFVANRLTFLIQTLHPIVFDTSTIETVGNTMTIAVNEAKTYPRIGNYDELGYITCQINNSPELAKEIEEFLEDTGYSNIYCFPDRIVGHDGVAVWAVKFVVYPRND